MLSTSWLDQEFILSQVEDISQLLLTGDGVVAMDPINPKHSELMIKEIKEVTDEPIKFIIMSHNHWDHSGGNGLFREKEPR